jgi:hypothetical protein
MTFDPGEGGCTWSMLIISKQHKQVSLTARVELTGFRNVLPALKLRPLIGGEEGSTPIRRVGWVRSRIEAFAPYDEPEGFSPTEGDASFKYFVGIGGGGLDGGLR